MKRFFGKICLAAMVFALPIAAFSQGVIEKTQKLVGEIIENSFPELKPAKIEIEPFRSDSNFFKSQFSVARFFTFQRLHYAILVNPEVYRRDAPEDGIRAILAHELAHVLYYRRINHFKLFGLARLAGKGFAARFERRADLEAIARGYGEGLKSYRVWLYQNIPSKNVEAKRRDYFSPEEIDLMLKILREKPSMLDVWLRRAPRNLSEIGLQ